MKTRIPPLDFPDVEYGTKETPWDLNILLYSGGSTARVNIVQDLVRKGDLGPPLKERIPLVSRIHEEINASLKGGYARGTAACQIERLRYLFGFAERHGLPLTIDAVQDTFLTWADNLLVRTRMKRGGRGTGRGQDRSPLGKASAFNYGSLVAALLDRVLERHTALIELTRLECPDPRKSPTGIQAEKQDLSQTFAFGHLLGEICDFLTVARVRSEPLPMILTLSAGKSIYFKAAGGFLDAMSAEDRETFGCRYPISNARIVAELYIFIGQTGMNIEQAHNLKLRNFFYASHLDGYQVKEHKARRGGAVLFEIFKDYKSHFERYLAWRRSLFPNSTRLFPFIRFGRRVDDIFQPNLLRRICNNAGVQFVHARSLRSTRVNWMLRRSADPALTAEMHQHTEATLLTVYHRPSLQRAMVEVTRFWRRTEPLSMRTLSVAPGGCTGQPATASGAPEGAPRADCRKASGCLWCDSHRDVDSMDHVWALASFRYLKSIEQSLSLLPGRDTSASPAGLAVTRITDKLRWYEESNKVRKEWVAEAEARIAEGSYHPDWSGPIRELEGNTP